MPDEDEAVAQVEVIGKVQSAKTPKPSAESTQGMKLFPWPVSR